MVQYGPKWDASFFYRRSASSRNPASFFYSIPQLFHRVPRLHDIAACFFFIDVPYIFFNTFLVAMLGEAEDPKQHMGQFCLKT